jgi:hypothetical protein
MTRKANRHTPFTLDLTGLTTAPAQTWGAVRLVPLLRAAPIRDLRLHPRLYDPHDVTVVRINPRTAYLAFVPHAFVATWSADGSPVAAYGTQLCAPDAETVPAGIQVRFRRRMVRREPEHALRFLPLHLALEGYLTLHFGGPSIAWQEWTHRAVEHGLSPRIEAAYTGAQVPDLADALRIFEIHPDQCGMVLYTGDTLAAAFVVPHPGDYRALHPTLLLNLFCEQIEHYAMMFPDVPELISRLDGPDDDPIRGPADLRARLTRAIDAWQELHTVMVGGLIGAPLHAERVYRMGRYTLNRFQPAYDPATENHLGEAIVDDAGRLAYLSTFRLSAAQTRRGYLLSRLAAHDWRLDQAAASLGTDRDGLVDRLNRAGFGHLLRPDILDPVLARHRR